MLVGLTGATGRLGRVVQSTLERSGCAVRTIGRDPQSAVQVDLTDEAALRDAFPGLDVVVHAAGKTGEDSNMAVNVDIAAAVANAAAAAEVPVINLSSLSVYGKSTARTVGEDSPAVPHTPYGTSKLEAERRFDESGAVACHLRIGNVFDEDMFLATVGGRVKQALKGKEVTSLVLPQDVADVVRFVASLESSAWPRVANVVRPGLGDRTYAEIVAVPPRVSAPAVIPHLIRRARGARSIRASTVFRGDVLDALGFEYPPLSEVTPAWSKRLVGRLDLSLSLDQLRILHATDSVDRELGAGTATRTIDVAEQMARRADVSSVVSLGGWAPTTRRTLNGVDYTALRSVPGRFWLPTPTRQMAELVAAHDVIHLMGHWSPLNVWLGRIAERQGKPYVICPAGSLPIWGRSSSLKRLFNWLVGDRFVERASGWIAVVADEVPDFVAHGVRAEDVSIIPNAIDPDRHPIEPIDAAVHRRDLGVEGPYVLFLGRLNPIKGPDLLLEAFLDVAGEIDVDVVFAGPDGGLRDGLRDRAAGSTFADRVHFVGFVGGDVKESLLAGCEALVVPSRKEAMSTVAIEAALHVKPLVATTQCGLNDLLADGGGWAVDPTAEGLARALRLVAGADSGEHGREFSQRVVERFGWTTVSQLYRDLYRSALRSNP